MSLSINQARLKKIFIAQRGVWTPEWEDILRLRPDYLEAYIRVRDAAQQKNRLSPKVQEFIYIAVAASCTHIHAPTVRAHIAAALAVGATTAEITEVIGLTYLVGFHSVTVGVPILLEVMEEEGLSTTQLGNAHTERCARMKESFVKQRGFWPENFAAIAELDPEFFEAYTDFSGLMSKDGVLQPKIRELVTCAFDIATSHLYSKGAKIHMRNALRFGATPDEIMEMMEISSLMGIHGVLSSLPLLAEQLDSSVTASEPC